jgi:hypothetical protein
MDRSVREAEWVFAPMLTLRVVCVAPGICLS